MFRWDEVVRVVDVSGLGQDSARFLGATGTVSGPMPDRGGRGWAVGVEFAVTDEHETFWEHQLESTGLQEVYDEAGPYLSRGGNPVSHVPLPQTPPEAHWHELSIELLVPAGEESVEDVLERLTSAVKQILGSATVETLAARRDDEYVDSWTIAIDVRTAGSCRDAFERLVAAYDGDWQVEFDDGWSATFAWWRTSAKPGESGFLIPETRSVFIHRHPWSDPTHLPVPQGRNRGLDDDFVYRSFLPPPVGYE